MRVFAQREYTAELEVLDHGKLVQNFAFVHLEEAPAEHRAFCVRKSWKEVKETFLNFAFVHLEEAPAQRDRAFCVKSWKKLMRPLFDKNIPGSRKRYSRK
jgi:hypothetical protein